MNHSRREKKTQFVFVALTCLLVLCSSLWATTANAQTSAPYQFTFLDQSNNLQSSPIYIADIPNGTLDLHRTDGAYASVINLYNDNAEPPFGAALNNGVCHMTLQTDNAFQMTCSYGGYPPVVRTLFDLDTDGHIDLMGSNYGTPGGGIGTDPLNGDTCIVESAGGQFLNCPPQTTRFNATTGLATQYAGLQSSKESNGFAFIARSVESVLTGSVSGYPLFTAAARGYGGPGLYRLDVYLVATTPVDGATMQFTVSYNDGQAVQTLTSGPPIWFNTQGALLTYSQPLYLAAGASVTVSTVTTNSPTYHALVRLVAE